MGTVTDFIKEFYALIVAFIGSGAASGWFLKTLDYNREKNKSQDHLKANLLDSILEQSRILEKELNKYPGFLNRLKEYIEDESIDEVTGYPNKMFDFDTESDYSEYILQLNDEKKKLRHLHQDYVIKTKSEDLSFVKAIDESVTEILNFEIRQGFNFEKAREEHLIAITNLRTIYHQIKEYYPEDVPVEQL